MHVHAIIIYDNLNCMIVPLSLFPVYWQAVKCYNNICSISKSTTENKHAILFSCRCLILIQAIIIVLKVSNFVYSSYMTLVFFKFELPILLYRKQNYYGEFFVEDKYEDHYYLPSISVVLV